MRVRKETYPLSVSVALTTALTCGGCKVVNSSGSLQKTDPRPLMRTLSEQLVQSVLL